jgi:multicomponent K+:H+ antiporter subunit G
MLQSRPVVHEILIAIFMTVTTPITLMLLVGAALSRDGQVPNRPTTENNDMQP